LVRTIYPHGSSKETANDALLETLSYTMKGYSMDFGKLNLEYMNKAYNLFRNLPLSYLTLAHSPLQTLEHLS